MNQLSLNLILVGFHLNSKLRHLSYLDNSPVKLSPKENLLLKNADSI